MPRNLLARHGLGRESWVSSFSESLIVHSYRKVPFKGMAKYNSRMLCSKVMKLLF